MKPKRPHVTIGETRPDDIPGIIELCRLVYPDTPPWTDAQLQLHLRVFPEGQMVAVDQTGRVVGMASSLIVRWDDYDIDTNWREMTRGGWFTNHDPTGRTLYGAEVMVHPELQGRGIGKKMYAARRDLARRLGLLRIRAGARLRGYHRYAHRLTPEAYVIKVIRGELRDPTLTFQLRQRFRVIAVVSGYLRHDPESLGYAAVIEWINHDVARHRDWRGRDARYARPRGRKRKREPNEVLDV